MGGGSALLIGRGWGMGVTSLLQSEPEAGCGVFSLGGGDPHSVHFPHKSTQCINTNKKDTQIKKIHK